MSYRIRRLLCGLCAVMLVSFLGSAKTAWAQATGTITGTVTDPSGAVIPNATVTVTQQETGTKQSSVTNGDGLYSIAGLTVGHYTMSVTAGGFQTFQRTGIMLNTAQTLQENAQLTVGANSQTVTVQADTVQVQTETNEVSSLISGQQMSQISTNGRNFLSLETLGTGVSGNLPAFNGVSAQTSTATISFNGMRPDHNNFLIDGGEVYDRGSGGKPDALPSPDAIAQFQVLASNYPPDYGISSGGTVLVELKSGSQHFHGGVWEFNRNDDFDAGYYFFKQNHKPSPELRLNIFGGNIGGPVWKKNTFFFVNEEWRRYIQGANPSVTQTVPANDFPTAGAALAYTPFNNGKTPIVPATTDKARLALYSQDGLTQGQPFPGNVIPANLLDPNAVAFMGTGAIPKPNSGTQNYLASPKQPTYVHEDVVRIDHNLGSRFHLMGSWIHDNMSQTIFPTMWSGDSYTTVGDVFANPSWGAAVRLTQTLSPNLLNETGLYVNGNKINVQPAGIYKQPSGWSAQSFFNNNLLNRLPQVSFSGGPLNTTWSVIYWPWHNSYLDYQLRDDLSLTKGKHSLKFGFSYMREDKNQQQQADTEGDYSFNGSQFSNDSYVNFLLGDASSYAQLQQMNTDHWLNNTYSFYAMDNWHLSPRLTLNLGLRYDALPHVYEKNNRVSTFNPKLYNAANAATFSTAGTICTSTADPGCTAGASPGLVAENGGTFYLNGMELAGQNGVPRGLVKNDYWTWEPRVGFAWDFGGNGRTVLRGGAGIFYERVQGNDIYNLSTNPPFAYQPSVNNVYFSNPHINDKSGAVSTLPVAAQGMTSMNYYYPNPGTIQYSLGIQQQLAPSVVAAVTYVGSGGWNQDDLREINDLPLSAIAQRQAVATGGANGLNSDANLYRPYRGFGNMRQEENAVNFNYNSLQAALRMDARHGLTVQLAYTYSHEIDIQSADLTTSGEAGTGGTLSDPYNAGYDRGSGNFDRRHILNANYIYDLPFFAHSNGLTRTALGGWVFSGVTQAEAGSPVNIYYNGPDTLGLGGNTANRPNVVGPRGYPKTQQQWFNTSAFANPVAPWNGGTNNGFGNARKDAVVGPGLFNWNLSLFKDFLFTPNSEGPRLELRVESFNTFNHTEFNGIDTGTKDSTYGQVTSTYDPRVFQFGGKLMF